MKTVSLLGAKNGINVNFTVPGTTPEDAVIRINSTIFPYRVVGSPGRDEYRRNGLNIQLGMAPNAGDTVELVWH